MVNQCVILAGGLGTRLGDLTKDIPKSLIKINNNPFIGYQLLKLKDNGITNVLISIGHLGSLIKEYIDEISLPMNISFVDEGENLLGTAGAIRLAFDQNKLEDNFYVMYGDSFLLVDFNKINDQFIKNNQPLMTIYNSNMVYNCPTKSNVEIRRNNKIYYKSGNKNATHIDYGVSILTKDIIDKYIEPNSKVQLESLFTSLSNDNILYGYEVFDKFFEIGSINGINAFKSWSNNNFKTYLKDFFISNDFFMTDLLFGAEERYLAAQNPDLPKQKLKILASFGDVDLKEGVAKNISSDEEVLEILSKDENFYVKTTIFQNKNISEKTLINLYKEFPEHVLKHPNCPNSLKK